MTKENKGIVCIKLWLCNILSFRFRIETVMLVVVVVVRWLLVLPFPVYDHRLLFCFLFHSPLRTDINFFL